MIKLYKNKAFEFYCYTNKFRIKRPTTRKKAVVAFSFSMETSYFPRQSIRTHHYKSFLFWRGSKLDKLESYSNIFGDVFYYHVGSIFDPPINL